MKKITVLCLFLMACISQTESEVPDVGVEKEAQSNLWSTATPGDYTLRFTPNSGLLNVYWNGVGQVTFDGMWSGDLGYGYSGYAFLNIRANHTPITLHVPAGVTLVSIFGPDGLILKTVPFATDKVGGAGFAVVKDWDFGTNGNVKNTTDLVAEFDFHDPFNTFANGNRYGSVTVAPTQATSITYGNLPLPTPGHQPVEGFDVDGQFRTWTADTMLMHVRPLKAAQTTAGPAWKHDLGDGSIVAKYKLPGGGVRLNKDVLWETRIRVVPPPEQTTCPDGYWFALWTEGQKWDGGPEIDLVEGFSGNPAGGLIDCNAYHVDSVPMTGETVDYVNPRGWWQPIDNSTLKPIQAHNLKNWHVWTLVYHKDNTWDAYIDGNVTQHGTLDWFDSYQSFAPDMFFLFDGRALITDIWPINTTVMNVPPSGILLSYEIDYSRIYLRD